MLDIILNGKPVVGPNTLPSLPALADHLANTMSVNHPNDIQGITDPRPSTNIFTPITIEEVTLYQSKLAQSASGPDLVTTSTLKRTPAAVLAVLFNIAYARKIFPTIWNLTRTTMLYKAGDPELPNNYRPITVSSTIQRFFHRILAARLKKSVSLSVHQRGFTDIDGTLANALILNTYIRDKVSNGQAYNVVALDFAKAFDNLNQSSIIRGLQRFGVHPQAIGYIASTFATAQTKIRRGPCQSQSIPLRRGVKQGEST